MIVYPYNDNLTGYRNPWSGDNARESVEHAFICLCLQAQQTHAHAQIKGNELHHQSQISFHWHLAMLFLMLLIGMLPKSCSGACTTAHLQCPFLLPYLEINPTLLNTLKTPPQRRSRQNPKRNSKPPSQNNPVLAVLVNAEVSGESGSKADLRVKPLLLCRKPAFM